MKQVWITAKGAPETLQVRAAADPQAAAGQLRIRGAIAIGTASAGKHARLKDLGYAHCIDYRSQNFETEVMRYTGGRGVDVVLDPQGGNSFRRSYRCLAPLGRLFGEFDRLTPDMVEIVRLLGEGVLAPVVDKVFPFEQAAAAHHYLQERRNFGKVLLRAGE